MDSAGSNRFEIVDKLGEGGMGIVYEARDRERNMNVALKKLRRLEATSLYRFKREFRAVSDIDHPNIVSLYELVADDDEWFFTMEIIRGQDIIEYVRPSSDVDAEPDNIAQREPTTGDGHNGQEVIETPREIPHLSRFADLQRVKESFGQLARGLHALHQAGLVHRDLKPSNVLVAEDGRTVLMDFGIVADRTDDTAAARSARTVGTPAYMAPEQATGDPPTAAADWYAFGVMLHLALCGELPFSGNHRQILRDKLRKNPPPLRRRVRGVPAELAALGDRLLDRRAKKRPNPRTILRALGIDDDAGRASGVDIFVGRGRELEVLRRGLAATREGRDVSVFVIGESGMGKRTLIRHFLSDIQSESDARGAPLILRGRCHERESLSYNAFDGVIDNLSHALVALPASRSRRLLPDGTALLSRLFPVLRRVPGVGRVPYSRDMHPGDLRSRAATVLRSLLNNLAAQRPVVVCIDDLQWADRDSIELLVEIVGEPTRLMLIGTLRTDSPESEVWRAIDTIATGSECHRLTLGPLSLEEQSTLVETLTHHYPAAAASLAEAREFWTDTDGSPLLLTELIRFLDESDGEVTASAIPVAEVLYRRITRLPEGARALLTAAAVAGEPKPLEVLASAAALASEDVPRAVRLLCSGYFLRIVRPGPSPWVTTYHRRLEHALLVRLADDERAAIHRRIAEALEAAGGVSADRLARHWLGGGKRDKARRYLIEAAEEAEDKLAFDRAAELYRAALDLDESEAEGEGADAAPATDAARMDILAHLGDALQLAGRCYEAATVFERAAAVATGQDAVELARLAADNLLRSGHLQRGLERLTQVMEGLGERYSRTTTGALASLLLSRARLALRRRHVHARAESEFSRDDLSRLDTLYAAATTLGFLDHLRGAAIQNRHVLAALKLGEGTRVCRALALEYGYLKVAGRGDPEELEALGDEVLAQAREGGDAYLLGVVLVARGCAQFFSGQLTDATETLRECGELLRTTRRAVEWERLTARYMLALTLIARGDLSGADRTDERDLLAAERRDDVYTRTLFLCIPGTWALLSADQPETADGRLDTALSGWPEDAFYVGNYVEVYARVLIRIYVGDGGAALRLMDAALPHIRRLHLHHIGWVWAEINTLIARAALQISSRDPGDKRARKRVRRSIAIIARTGMTYNRGMAALLRAALHAQDGESDGARAQLASAVDDFVEIGARHLAAAARMRLGQLTPGDEGESLLSEGRAALQDCGVTCPEKMLELLAPGFAAETPSGDA